jgi:hypothetical protein
LRRQHVLSEPVLLDEIDLMSEERSFFSWSREITFERSGTMHGIAGWFECDLADGVTMTNSPLADHPISRPQAFFPIDELTAVREGETASVEVMGRPEDHLFAWSVKLENPPRRFSHSTWFGSMYDEKSVRQVRQGGPRRLNRTGIARLRVLTLCDGIRSPEEIEKAVLSAYPDLFPTKAEASRFITHVIAADTD